MEYAILCHPELSDVGVQMTSTDAAHDAKALSAPYVAYPSLKRLFSNLTQHGVPSRIDRTILTRSFSGGVGGQLLTALRFLKLMQGDNVPTEQMYDLVAAYRSDKWGETLLVTLKEAYPALFELELEFATAGQFTERFRKSYPAADDVLRKCITFFLNAARETPIKISAYILQNTKPRSATPKKRTSTPAAPKLKQNKGKQDNLTPDPQFEVNAQRKLSEQVLGILDADQLPKEVEQAVFVLLKHLRKEGL